ncbi:biotin transporter BioY [Lachnospiraceae bacterium 62-35]
MKKGVSQTRDMILCGMFAALIAAGAFIKIPIPVVPFTLQFLFTTLAGLFLGGKLGALSVCLYIGVGLMGLPVFASGGGPAYVLQPSFGYLIGFVLGTWLTGTMAHGKQGNPSDKQLFAACFAGLLVVYACGMAYYWMISTFYLGTGIGLFPLFLYCFVLAVPGDIVLCLVSVALGKRLLPVLCRETAV